MTLQDLTGQIFGQYELRQLIGVGGMGAVYRGFQANLEREVAIKVLSTALASETGYIERFYREAKTAAALEHAHIVPVYDYGIQRDISYVIMRLLAGGTLAERVRFCLERERSLPAPSEVGELLRQVASALDYAHSQGVIHRDIKPSNIMFDNQGNAYLVDFGIAKLMEATSSLTGTGVAMGTPIYMPPEQWRSENLAPAADQYALAATVYGLLTGRAPYEASTPFGLMHKHLNETPTPVHLRRPGLPESVSAVLERALAKASGDRFATVTAFAQAYTSAIAGSEGKPTGFFTVKLPESARQEGPPRTPSSPRPPTPSSGGAPRGAPPPSEPSLPAMPTGAGKPIHRSPVVWALALGLVAALAVIGFLVLGQGGDGGAGTPAPGDLTGTALAAVPTPTETPTVPALVTATPLPSKTPEPTATPEPTETVTATDTVTATATDTLQPTETPTVAVGLIVLSPTYTPSDTPAPTDTLTPTRTPRPTATPWPTRTPTKTPRPTATPWPTRTPTLAWEPVFAVVKTTSASIRPVPKPTAGELGQVGQGTRMPVTGRTANSQYVRVEYRGREGWMFFSFVEIEGDLGSVPVIEAETEGVLALVGPRAVIIYAAPDLYADRIETVENVELPITGRTADGGWYRVEWQGREAWIVNSYYLRTQGDKSTIPVVEVKAEEEVAPTSRPAAYPAGAPNADWTPVAREFNGLPMVYVPAGCFVIGSTDPQIDVALEQCRADYGPCERDWFTDEKPRSEVCLDAFWIGQTEVTNAQYQACVQAGACSPLQDRRYAGNADHPVVSVDWFQARDYAAWVGGALPSEAQWEYAARGPQGLQYPWGEEFDGNWLNYCDVDCANEWRHVAYDDGYAQTAPVGSFPAGASWVGALDLSGNVWEWTSTLYREYPYRAGDGREDPASAGWGWVLRGGSWNDGRFNARAADRLGLQPSTTDFHYGFRIVMAESGPAPDAGAVETAPEPTGVMLRVWGQETPLRVAPTAGAAEIARLPAGIQLEILGRNAEANYFLVSYRGQQGWVWLSYVSILGDLSAVPVIEAEAGQVFAVVKTTSASIRPVPKLTAGELGQVSQGTRMPVTGRTANGQYVRVEYRGREGWMFFSFVEIEGDLDSVPVIEAETEGVLALVGPRAVIIYAAPDLYADRIETVENVELPITGRTADGRWYRVEWQGREAWIVNSYYLRTQGDKSTIPVVEVEAEEVAPTLTAANTFLGVILQADFSGPISEFSTAAEGWYVSRTWGNPEICVQAPSDTSRRLVLDMPATLGDYLVETEVRFVSPFGRLALLTRLDSSGAGYRHEMELTPTDRTVRQYYYPPSGDLGSLSGYAKTATQHILRAEVQGDTIRTYLDGRLVGAATDPNRSAGSVAFEVGPNTHVCIFQLTVRSLHSSPEAMRNAQITEAIRDANLRSGPGTDYRIVGEVSAGDRLFIMEWSLDRSWAYVRTDRDHSHAWIWTELIREQ